jgi:thymidylate kinase
MTATPTLPAMTRSDLFRHFVRALDDAAIPYCILGAFDRYPEHVGSDVDFMVRPSDMKRLAMVLRNLAADNGCNLLQALEHETTACYFVIGRSEPNGETLFFHPDASSDYRRYGRLWLSAEEIIARRRLHQKGFFVPAAEDAFVYYLIKRIDKKSIETEHLSRLESLYSEAPEACAAAMRRYWSETSASGIEHLITTGDASGFASLLETLQAELGQSAKRESIISRAAQWSRELRRQFHRFVRPSGLFVAVLGPDGSGKSSVLEVAIPRLAPAFRRTSRMHLRPGVFGKRAVNSAAVTDPHGGKKRSALMSLAKLLYLAADYWVGYLLWVRPQLVRSTLVVFDRYYHDLLIDPTRYRYGAPMWIARAVGRLMPQPDIWILLDAPAEVLQRRKQEVTYAESARQSEAYLRTVSAWKNGRVVDASLSLPQVVAQVNSVVIRHLAERMDHCLSQSATHPPEHA